MKLRVLVAVVGLVIPAATTAAADGASPVAHTSSQCVPSIKTVKGHTEVGYCGPATATLTISGKSYDFTGGTCTSDAAAHIPLSLTLGTIVAKVSNNGGLPLFQLMLLNDGKLSIDTVTADIGGKQLTQVGPVSVKGSIPSSGTFTSTKSLLSGPTKFSGTWNCHGSVVATP